MSTDSSEFHGGSSAPEQGSGNRFKLVTVHGTGAGDVTAAGDRWWQLGSAFLNELGKRLDLDPSQIEISPFQWQEGPNSEEQRRAAGTELYLKLKNYDMEGHDYFLIGHSHGGSVIYNALLRSVANKDPLERLKCWCTVGTPFLDYQPNKFLFQRLKSLGLTLYTTGIVAFILGVWVLARLQLQGEADATFADMGYALLIYGSVNYSLLWLYERFRKTWFTRAQKKATEKLYSGRWLGYWHQEDEAISALSNIKTVSAPIIPRTFLQPLVAITQFLLVIALGFYFAHDLAFNEGETLKWLAKDLLEGAEDSGVGYLTWMTSWMIVVFCIPVIWLLTALLGLLAKMLGRPLAWILNGVIWTSIKQRAWGDDVVKEDVCEIGSHPPEFPRIFEPLPDAVANPLRTHSENHAILTLQKVREVLGMSQNAQHVPDLRSELSESLTWQELIHTAYFDVPEFIDLVAQSLHTAGLAVLRER